MNTPNTPEALPSSEPLTQAKEHKNTIHSTREKMGALLKNVQSPDARALYDLMKSELEDSADDPQYTIGKNRSQDRRQNEIEFRVGV